MFEKLKKSIVKAIVAVFVGLLVLSFAVWGIGDVFRGGTGGDTLVTVDDFEVTLPQAESRLEQELRELRQRSGRYIERDQAMAMGLGQRVLAELITDRTIEAHARALGVEVDDATLARITAANPVFQVGGRFSKQRFDELLRANAMTEQGYLQLVRLGELRRLLVDSVTAAAAPPAIGLDLLHRHREEQREGRVLEVRADAVEGVAEPDEAALAAYLKEHQAEYRAPEYRTITVVTMRPEDLAPEIEIPEDRLRAAYDERAQEFTEPASRTVLQIDGPDEATLGEVRSRIQAGEPAEAVASELADRGVQVQDLGSVARGGFPDRIVEDVIFAAPVGGVSEITQTGFGNRVMFVVQTEEPERRQPFEEVRDRLHDELALAQAADDLPSLENAVQDRIAGGASLEEAAQAGGFTPRRIEKTDQIGHDRSGEPIEPELPEEVLQTAFATSQGVISPMETLADGGAYLVQVDAIEPERDRRLDEVRDEVRETWLGDARQKRAKEVAKALHEEVLASKSLEEAASGQPAAAVVAIGPVKRTDMGETGELGPQSVERLFASAVGQPPEAPLELPNGYGFVVVDRVIPAEGEPGDALEGEITSEMATDLADQYDQALRQRFPPVVHERALATFLRADGQPQ
ncbi:peptidylprolyl isomerase [Geminicoccus flavidas]|uniref:peptidylprolyl isomerase n=1 Tax=Geminicoccus flavidas TaxID=2506407 RepID=UPI001358FB61|nr:peptidylprolyl isomerase [Geminicoccus flavidas]